MNKITRIGVDLAKRVLQVHAVDASGQRIASRALSRDKFLLWCAQLPAGCMLATEANSSAHHWACRLRAIGLDARIIAAHLVAPYRMQGKSCKNNDAAICEAVDCPHMRFVPIKMGPHRAVRIWAWAVRPIKPICRCAFCASFPASPLHATARNTVTRGMPIV